MRSGIEAPGGREGGADEMLIADGDVENAGATGDEEPSEEGVSLSVVLFGILREEWKKSINLLLVNIAHEEIWL